MITAESSKEEVGNYLVETLKLKGEIKDIIIKEDISGDILLEITDEEYKSIGIKPVQFRKIKGLLDKIKDKFGEKHYTEVISIYSNSNDVSEFFKKSLNFEGDLNNLDGKSLLELSDEAIKNLGLNLGQRKKLIKYISYFKTLKVEPPKEPTINKESSLEEVVSYLTKKLKISEEGINSIKEDLGVEGGESLIFLEESDIDTGNLTDEEKVNLKNLVNELKNKEKEEGKGEGKEDENEEDIIITKETDKDTLIKFLKNKCKISDKGINAIINGQEVEDGMSFLLLEPKDFDDVNELNDDEKNVLKNVLNELKPKEEEKIKPPTKETKLEDLKIYLSKILNISENGIKEIIDLGVEDGETFFCLESEDIDGTKELTQEVKEKIKSLLKQGTEGEKKDNVDNKKENDSNLNDNIPKNNNNDNPNNINPIPEKTKNEEIAKKDLEKNDNKDLDQNNKDLDNINKDLNNNNKGNNNDEAKNKIKNEKNQNQKNKKNEKIEGIINGIYEGKDSEKIYIYELNQIKKSPIINDSKFNVFFIFSEKESMIKYIKLGAFLDKGDFFPKMIAIKILILIYYMKINLLILKMKL